jgi:hypothetical protein
MQDVKPMSTPMGSMASFGCGRGRRTSGPARVPEHDRLPPLSEGDEARHIVQCVSVRSFSGFAEDITSTGREDDLQVPIVCPWSWPLVFFLLDSFSSWFFLMPILLVAESRGSLLLVLVSFLGPRWFRGLPASSLV